MRERTYLAYGSNLHPRWLQSRVPSARLVETVVLEGWQLLFNKYSRSDGSAKCNIIPGETTGARVYGAVYRFDAREQKALDRAEGGYDCVTIELPGLGESIIYLAPPKNTNSALRPYAWYRDIVVAGAILHGFPVSYITRLENITAIKDPDSGRDRKHRAIVWPGDQQN